jgi:hypothetical protein
MSEAISGSVFGPAYRKPVTRRDEIGDAEPCSNPAVAHSAFGERGQLFNAIA